MCGFYSDEQKIKKGDIALLDGEKICVVDAKHIKENKTMDINYTLEDSLKEKTLNFPYKTITSMKLIKRVDTI